jgi:hypothetical protein
MGVCSTREEEEKMSTGFRSEKGKATVIINDDEVGKILKKYKKLNKYRKSSLFTVKTIDGTENIISSLIKEAEENPID